MIKKAMKKIFVCFPNYLCLRFRVNIEESEDISYWANKSISIFSQYGSDSFHNKKVKD